MKSRLVVSVCVLSLVAVTDLTACRKKSTDAAPQRAPLSRHDCSEVMRHAGRSVGVAVASANPPGRHVCASDGDCVEVEAASCVKVCSGHGVPRGAAAAFTSAMKSIEESDCRQWTDGDCEKQMPRDKGPCPTASPRCVEGVCKMTEP